MSSFSSYHIVAISLSAGAGHVQAARAIEAATRDYDNITCTYIDLADYMQDFLRTFVLDGYHSVSKHIPLLWKILFELTDTKQQATFFARATAFIQEKKWQTLRERLEELQPDHIICTHFMPANVLLSGSQKIDIPVSIVITDYGMHSWWYVTHATHYFVATEDIAYKLRDTYGVASQHVTVSGIPVHPDFYQTFDTAETRARYNIPPYQPVILVMAGGQGLLDTHSIVTHLLSLDTPHTIIAIAGKNEKLYEDLSALEETDTIALRVLEWTDDIPRLMKLANMVISKPGGITTTECMVTQTPLIAIDPIPGQEEFNATFIQQQNIGSVADSYETLLDLVINYSKHSTKKLSLHSNLHSQPPATDVIIKKICNIS